MEKEKEKTKKKKEDKEVEVERVYIEVPRKENKVGSFFKFLILIVILGLI